MRLESLLRRDRIRCGLPAGPNETLLRALAELIPPQVPGVTADELMAALAERARQGPFSMGKGVAYLHARTEKVPGLLVALGTCPDGVDFKAPDGQPIRVMLLFAIPRRHSDLYLTAMAAFLNFFAKPENLERVARAADPDAVLAALAAHDTGRPGPSGTLRDVTDNPPACATASTRLCDVVALMSARGLDELPVVDAEGTLVGYVRAMAILKAAVAAHLDNSAHNSPPSTAEDGFRSFLARHGDRQLSELGQFVEDAAPRAVDEDERLPTVAIRLARTGASVGYVLREGRLVGLVRLPRLLEAAFQQPKL